MARDTLNTPEVGDLYLDKQSGVYHLVARIRDTDNYTIVVNDNGTYYVAIAGTDSFKKLLEGCELVKASEDHPYRVEHNNNWTAAEEVNQYLVVIIRILKDMLTDKVVTNAKPDVKDAAWDGQDVV